VAAEVELDEEKAFARALAEGRPGDLVVVLYESLAPLERLLDEAKARRSASGATLGEVFASPPP
jgi:hypothetical protein